MSSNLVSLVVWIYCAPPDLKCFDQYANLRVGIMAISGIETLMQLGLLDEANF